MKIEKLIGSDLCNSISEMRESSEHYDELVFFSKDISNWHSILTEKLGQPLISEIGSNDSSEEALSLKKDDALKIANSHGGISKGQTLYFGTYNSSEILIMLWPWQDNAHVTLKKIIP